MIVVCDVMLLCVVRIFDDVCMLMMFFGDVLLCIRIIEFCCVIFVVCLVVKVMCFEVVLGLVVSFCVRRCLLLMVC